MSENQKQEIKKVEEPKKVLKLCPFISGFLLEPVRDKLGNQVLGKTTTVAPCIADKCMFFNETEQCCKIVQGLDDLHTLSSEIDDNIDDEEEIQGEGTDE